MCIDSLFVNTHMLQLPSMQAQPLVTLAPLGWGLRGEHRQWAHGTLSRCHRCLTVRLCSPFRTP